MPFKSEKQRRYLHANNPAMAKRWEAEEKKRKKGATKRKSARKKATRKRGK